MSLEVSAVKISKVLSLLKTGAWQVPQFQREFVWTESQILQFVQSIFACRPIGMVTLWAQPDEQALPLEPVNIPDWVGDPGATSPRYFGTPGAHPNQYFAILDGRQRCTAIAMVFGGLRAEHGRYRYSGRFFLNVAETDPTEQIVFKKNSDIVTEGLNTLSVCIGNGLFPLAVPDDAVDGLFGQWLTYTQSIRDPANYPNGEFPSEDELSRREALLRKAFNGLNETMLAVYSVPDTYSLDEICDIFETLNTTGTRVSTVDLIHATLFAETQNDQGGALLLRDWIADLSQIDGAVGWADPERRPELVTQIVTACYVALDKKPKPRSKPGYSKKEITSVKSSDLLATPADHWRHVVPRAEELARYLGDFQRVTADGLYPMRSCPYPVTSAIYAGLRWHLTFDIESNRSWGQDELNSLFSAFFWRNALTGRYDQGFLTQLGKDVQFLREILDGRSDFATAHQWAAKADDALWKHMDRERPTESDLRDLVEHGRLTGARKKAALLPLVARAMKDPLDPGRTISFPEVEEVELHHVYPRAWCRTNRFGNLADVLKEESSGKYLPESAVNMLPMSRLSNRKWTSKLPGQAIVEAELTFEPIRDIWERAFISKGAFEALTSDHADPGTFWTIRSGLMTDYFKRKLAVRI
jgi:hypothetical protein